MSLLCFVLIWFYPIYVIIFDLKTSLVKNMDCGYWFLKWLVFLLKMTNKWPHHVYLPNGHSPNGDYPNTVHGLIHVPWPARSFVCLLQEHSLMLHVVDSPQINPVLIHEKFKMASQIHIFNNVILNFMMKIKPC